MAGSKTVRMALTKKNMSQADLARAWGTSIQSMNNKFFRDTWSSDDLMKVAEFTGAKLAFVFPDGQQLIFLPDDPDPKK